jgi:hypothetical protein
MSGGEHFLDISRQSMWVVAERFSDDDRTTGLVVDSDQFVPAVLLSHFESDPTGTRSLPGRPVWWF